MDRYIVHVDMDAFFAAIEQRDNKDLRNKPVVIGADPKGGRGRGVVSTCSYEARKFGIHSAMPISIAYKKCPQAVFLRPDMKKYGKVSRDIFEIFYTFTPKVEVISVDEAFLDITGSFHIFGTPSETGRLIKSKIKNDIGLTASIGLAPTKMAAKIASDLSKPDGFIEVTDDNLLDFLRPLEVSKISGLGAKSKAILNDRGIKTIGELAKADLESIKNIFGKNGMSLWFLANGIDDRGVENSTEVKSISNEFTFDSDTNDRQKIEKILMHLSEKVSARLREEGFRGKTVTLKIRLEGFSTYNRSMSLVKATSFVDTTYKTAIKLFNEFNLKGKKVRLIGVKVSNLIPKDSRDTLFTGVDDEKKERLHEAGDKLREKFGSKAIYRAANL